MHGKGFYSKNAMFAINPIPEKLGFFLNWCKNWNLLITLKCSLSVFCFSLKQTSDPSDVSSSPEKNLNLAPTLHSRASVCSRGWWLRILDDLNKSKIEFL